MVYNLFQKLHLLLDIAKSLHFLDSTIQLNCHFDLVKAIIFAPLRDLAGIDESVILIVPEYGRFTLLEVVTVSLDLVRGQSDAVIGFKIRILWLTTAI